MLAKGTIKNEMSFWAENARGIATRSVELAVTRATRARARLEGLMAYTVMSVQLSLEILTIRAGAVPTLALGAFFGPCEGVHAAIETRTRSVSVLFIGIPVKRLM